MLGLTSRHLTFSEWEKEQWEEWGGKENVKFLEIPNYLFFRGDQLIIFKYPKLKRLIAGNCALKMVCIADCPLLQNVFLANNKIRNLTLTRLPKLRTLDVGNNELTRLREINKCKESLKVLICHNNFLREIEIKGFLRLNTLYCFRNYLERLDCSGNVALEDLNCSGGTRSIRSLSQLILKGCINIKRLDADMNSLTQEYLNFSELVNLQFISVRQNNLIKISNDDYIKPIPEKNIILNSSHLKLVDYKLSDIKRVEYLTPVTNPEELKVINDWIDEGYTSGDEFAERHEDSPTLWEQHAYEDQQRREQELKEYGKGIYEGEECLDMSGWGRTKFELDGASFPKSIKSINLGNNNAHTAHVMNFPNLERLILAHNAINKPVLVLSTEEYQKLITKHGSEEQVKAKYCVIVNCPKLNLVDLDTDSDVVKTKSLYGFLYNDPSRQSEEEREYNDELDNPYKQEDLLEKIMTNPANYTLPQIEQQLNFEQVPLMERGVLLELLKTKAEAQEEQAWAALCARFSLDKVEEEKAFEEKQTAINSLLEELRNANYNEDWTKSDQLLNQLKNDYWPYMDVSQQADIKELEAKIQQSKLQSINSATTPTEQAHSTTLIFISASIFVLGWAALLIILTNQVSWKKHITK